MKKCNVIKWLAVPLLAILTSLTLSCGKNGEEEADNTLAGPGTVAVFITDNISYFKQVIATVDSVSLVNTDARRSCAVLKTPVTLDLSNLTNFAQFVDAAECPSGPYNRIDIRFQRDVLLMDQLDTPSACRFAFSLDENGGATPLACDPNGECGINIRGAARQGAVTVRPGTTNDLGIDFNLKQFEVADFGDPQLCSVSLKASAMDAASLNNSGRAHGLTGAVADFDPSAKTFTITKAGRSFSVDYSAVNSALQPGIDTLLQTAVDNGLKVKVLGSSIDPSSGSITASRVFVKAEGTVSALAGLPIWTFTLTNQQGLPLQISYKPPAVVDGTLADGVWAAVTLDGYRTDEYLLMRAEILPQGMAIED